MLPSPSFSSSSPAAPAADLPGRKWLQPACAWLHPGRCGQVVRECFNCETCRMSFSSNDDMESHVEDHIPCAFADCHFEANYRTILEHETSVHMRLGGRQRHRRPVRVPDSAEEIAKWKSERQQRFPRISSGTPVTSAASASNSEAGPVRTMLTAESKPFVTVSMTAVPGIGTRVTATIRNRNERFNGREKRSQQSKGRRPVLRRGAAVVRKKLTLFQKLTGSC